MRKIALLLVLVGVVFGQYERGNTGYERGKVWKAVFGVPGAQDTVAKRGLWRIIAGDSGVGILGVGIYNDYNNRNVISLVSYIMPSDTSAHQAFDRIKGSLDLKEYTIFVPAGTYYFYESAVFTNVQGVRIIGAGQRIYRFGSNLTGTRFVAKADISILKIETSAAGGLMHAGPYIEGISFIDSTVTQKAAVGIEIKNMNRWTINDCNFLNLKYGIYINRDTTGVGSGADASWGLLQKSHFFQNMIGDYAPNGGGHVVFACEFTNNDTALYLFGAQQRVFANKIDGGDVGIYAKTVFAQIVGNQIEGSTKGIVIDGLSDPTNDPTITIGEKNNIMGITFTSCDTAIWAKPNSRWTTLSNFESIATKSIFILDEGMATSIISPSSGYMLSKTKYSSIYGKAGLYPLEIQPGYTMPIFLINTNYGIIMQEDTSVQGGLWLASDYPHRAGIGTGFYGDIQAGTKTALSTSAIFQKFNSNSLEFYINSGLTTGSSFSPTLRMKLDDTNGLQLNDIPLKVGSNGASIDSVKIISGGANPDTLRIWVGSKTFKLIQE